MIPKHYFSFLPIRGYDAIVETDKIKFDRKIYNSRQRLKVLGHLGFLNEVLKKQYF